MVVDVQIMSGIGGCDRKHVGVGMLGCRVDRARWAVLCGAR